MCHNALISRANKQVLITSFLSIRIPLTNTINPSKTEGTIYLRSLHARSTTVEVTLSRTPPKMHILGFKTINHQKLLRKPMKSRCLRSTITTMRRITIREKRPRIHSCWEDLSVKGCRRSRDTLRSPEISRKEAPFWWQLTERLVRIGKSQWRTINQIALPKRAMQTHTQPLMAVIKHAIDLLLLEQQAPFISLMPILMRRLSAN